MDDTCSAERRREAVAQALFLADDEPFEKRAFGFRQDSLRRGIKMMFGIVEERDERVSLPSRYPLDIPRRHRVFDMGRQKIVPVIERPAGIGLEGLRNFKLAADADAIAI